MTPGEQEELRLQGNRQQEVASQVAGWSGNSGMISSGAMELPFNVVGTFQPTAPTNNYAFVVPTGYNHLRLVGDAICENSTKGPGYARMQFNNATASGSYSFQVMRVANAVSSARDNAQPYCTAIDIANLSGSTVAGVSTAGALVDVFIPNYNSTTIKAGVGHTTLVCDFAAASYSMGEEFFWIYRSSEPIRSLSIQAIGLETPTTGSNNFQPGTKISLLGHR